MWLFARMIKKLFSRFGKPAVIQVFCFLLLGPATAGQLSENAVISILTCGPGEPLYAVFGHTAIHVEDKANGIDRVYNFGTFDFNTRGFYFKFLRGKLDYTLSVTNFRSFYNDYVSENRSIYSQPLLLPPEALSDIYMALEENYLPQNRNYRYDFFEDNCTTRILDLIYENAGDETLENYFKNPAQISYREGLKYYLHHRPWLQLGINLLLGSYADKSITNYESLFLPDNLMTGLINTGWVGEPELLFQRNELPRYHHSFFSPTYVLWLLLIFYILEIIWFKTSKQTSENLELIIFILLGALGLLFLFLRLFSEHTALQSNMNILWANPLNLLLIVFFTKKWTKCAKIYLFLYALLIFFLIINWNKLPQKLPPDIMPLLALAAFRAVQYVFRFVQKPSLSG
jgi:hypothetical protein